MADSEGSLCTSHCHPKSSWGLASTEHLLHSQSPCASLPFPHDLVYKHALQASNQLPTLLIKLWTTCTISTSRPFHTVLCRTSKKAQIPPGKHTGSQDSQQEGTDRRHFHRSSWLLPLACSRSSQPMDICARRSGLSVREPIAS